jgi:hypothetical protein
MNKKDKFFIYKKKGYRHDNKNYVYDYPNGKEYYIMGKVIEDRNGSYLYKLISSNFTHNPKCKYYVLYKPHAYRYNQMSGLEITFNERFKWFDTLDELMVELL